MFLETLLNGTHSLTFVLFASFVAGILASFTPCIYPMIPITLGIITAQRSKSMLNNFFLSLSYGVGIATVYAMLGYVSVKTNLMFGQWLGHPVFIAAMIALFLYLAFAMFGFYEMYVPRFLQARSSSTYRGGSIAYSFLFGILSGAAASPCLTPALALLLGFVAKQNSPLVGFAVLFAFAMGISMLLIVVGTFSSALSFLPRAGSWMIEVKKIFGFMLLGVCVFFVQPLMAPHWINCLYALVTIIAAVYYFDVSKRSTNFRIPFRLISVTLTVLAALLLVDAQLQHKDSSLLEKVEEVFMPAKRSE